MVDEIVLTGRSSVLEACYSRNPIQLDPARRHYIGLVDFIAYNAIPNVDATNQKFYYGKDKILTVPRGSYEIEAIAKHLKTALGDGVVELRANNSTLQCELKCEFDVDFRPADSIGSLLGFGPRVLGAGRWHSSDRGVNIMRVNMILVECNIAAGSYVNDSVAHSIFSFSPNVPPGYKMVLSPKNIIYHRINTDTIDRLRINIVDQDGRPVDFSGEEVSLRLHIRSDG